MLCVTSAGLVHEVAVASRLGAHLCVTVSVTVHVNFCCASPLSVIVIVKVFTPSKVDCVASAGAKVTVFAVSSRVISEACQLLLAADNDILRPQLPSDDACSDGTDTISDLPVTTPLDVAAVVAALPKRSGLLGAQGVRSTAR